MYAVMGDMHDKGEVRGDQDETRAGEEEGKKKGTRGPMRAVMS